MNYMVPKIEDASTPADLSSSVFEVIVRSVRNAAFPAFSVSNTIELIIAGSVKGNFSVIVQDISIKMRFNVELLKVTEECPS